MGTLDDRHDVVIVGGRPAGAGLAGWLALKAPSLRVLMLDRADFPSAPAVPSCPTVHPGTLRLLDELGVPEAAIASAGVRVTSFRLRLRGAFTTLMTLPPMHGRDYLFSVDRARFDAALWANLARHPSVTARSGIIVSDVVRDADGRVTGVVAEGADGEKQTISARCVVFADGRFSALARKVGAKVTEDGGEKMSTVYFADWTGVAPMDGETAPEVQAHATARGLNLMFFPLDGGRTTVCVHVRADRAEVGGDAQAYYRKTLASAADVEQRLAGATQATKLLGMKRVGNGFREAAGRGWVLAGDALHYKDPVDGQGIYDALLETKLLAGLLAEATTDDAALPARYAAAVRDATRPMFLATVKRLENELYAAPPDLVVRTLLRRMLTDPGYQVRCLRFLGRDLAPDVWLTPRVAAGAMWRGVRRQLAGA
jgi:2-polyprenyl-6-methoxyphenol hydroxylase-like FAD-dependent oxidoreductase